MPQDFGTSLGLAGWLAGHVLVSKLPWESLLLMLTDANMQDSILIINILIISIAILFFSLIL